MREEELLENLREIRKSLQTLSNGMKILLQATVGIDEETQGELELEQPGLIKETLDKYRSYLS